MESRFCYKSLVINKLPDNPAQAADLEDECKGRVPDLVEWLLIQVMYGVQSQHMLTRTANVWAPGKSSHAAREFS